jgi:hypothetical protein
MTSISEATLVQRAAYLYRHLLLLQRLFQGTDEGDAADWLLAAEEAEAAACCVGIREELDDLKEQARILTTVPFPIREWRPGDASDDERWRALSQIERREVLSLASAYENLITWAEGQAFPRAEPAERTELRALDALASPRVPRDPGEMIEFLRAERARVQRFRQEMAFLDRRRVAESA